MIDAPEIPASLRLLNAAKLGKFDSNKKRAKQFARSVPVSRIEIDQFRAGLERKAKAALRNRDWSRLERLARMLLTFDPTMAKIAQGEGEK